jgi:DNA-binding GntR family transcriptional regulator
MTLQETRPVSADPRIYMRIATDVRDKLASGAIATGDTVPITGLARQWSTTRETASRALRALQRDGLLTLYPGIGYVVLPQAITPDPRSRPPDQARV